MAGGGGATEAATSKNASSSLKKEFTAALDDDLNISRVLSSLFALVGEGQRRPRAAANWATPPPPPS